MGTLEVSVGGGGLQPLHKIATIKLDHKIQVSNLNLNILGNSTLIILILEMLKFSKNISFKSKNIVNDIIVNIYKYFIC
jgi:hypothetical protein